MYKCDKHFFRVACAVRSRSHVLVNIREMLYEHYENETNDLSYVDDVTNNAIFNEVK